VASATAPLGRSVTRVRPASALAIGGPFAICAAGAALRLSAFGRVYTTPYYDAAVRSMGLSWHNFFYGALEPSGRISIDKAPIDLWLQVASTKVLGFSSVSLRLPPAIAGSVSVLLLYDLVRRGYGRAAGLAAALALAVLPTSVLTSRSDTMDAVMSMLLLAAAWLVVRARPGRRAIAVIAAGAVAGLAFEVKLFEAAVALPALALLALLALDGGAARKARILIGAGLAYLVAAAAWPVVASLLSGRHPYPLGSSNGQIWNAILFYNGTDRFGHPPTGATAPGLLRLFRAGPPREFGALIGVELFSALLCGALAAVCARLAGNARGQTDDQRRLRSAVGWGFGVWLVIGWLVASFMGRQWPRYLEAFTPAVAGVLGIGLVTIGDTAARRPAALFALGTCAAGAAFAGLIAGATPGPSWRSAIAGGAPRPLLGSAIAGGAPALSLGIAIAAGLIALVVALAAADVRPGRRGVLAGAATVLILAAALAVPLATSLRLVRAGAGDSAGAGNMSTATLRPLRAYLHAHEATARYELASASILKSAALIVKDARAVLVLTGPGGRALVSPRQLKRRIRAGQVRYALIGRLKCTSQGSGSGCAPVVRWVRSHATDVSIKAGLPRRGVLYRL
jgi:4-amino-4-deoxy-L-arabinose transferase-like glycosyltransferase